jgi:phytol kinase
VQIAIAFASVATLLGLMAAVKRLATVRNISAEVQRKLVHIGTGLYALTLPWLFTDDWPVYMLVMLTLIVMAILRMPAFAKGGISETLHGVERQSYGDFLLALAVGTVFLLADGRTVLYVLPIATLTLADSAAALTGSRYGRKFFTVEDGQKSIEGSTAFFMVTLVISMVCLLLMSDVSRPNVILLSVMVAAFGTLVEADSWRGFDNFFLPMGLLVFLGIHMDNHWQELLGLMILFLVSIVMFLRFAPKLGIKKHAARVYVIATFLLISVTALQNVALPLLVIVMHALTQHLNPSKADYPALDIVAAVALTSFGWLAIGLVAEANALMYYGLMSVGLCVGLAAVALGERPAWLRAGMALAVGIGLFGLYSVLMLYNPTPVHWPGDMKLTGTAMISVMVIAGSLRPALFDTHRAAKLAILALIVPAFDYGIRVMGA